MPKDLRAARAANASLHLDHADVHALTGQVNEAYEKIDLSMAHALRLQADMMETGIKMRLEPRMGQKLFRAYLKSINTMMTSRDELLSAHLQATRIRMHTDQAVYSEGCLPWPPTGIEQEETAPTLRAVG